VKILKRPIGWLFCGVEDGGKYGDRYFMTANVSIGDDKIANITGLLTTRTYDAEMSESIKEACAELGATKIRMVRFKGGLEQPPVLISLKPRPARP
jgi:hypothetical protein